MKLFVDTGVLVAAADASERRHRASAAILERPDEKLVTDAILSEAHHLIAARVGWPVAVAFLASIDHDLIVEPSTRADRERAVDLCQTYRDARLDFTDALTIAIAERLDVSVIATLDARHFRLVQPSRAAFELIP